MSMKDALWTFSTQQALTGTSATASTDIHDAGSAKKVFSGHQRLKLEVRVTAVGGTSPTFRAQLIGAGSADLTTTTPIVLWDSGVTRVLTSADLPYVLEGVVHSQLDAKRYYGVLFTLGGTTPTATVDAAMVQDAQTNMMG